MCIYRQPPVRPFDTLSAAITDGPTLLNSSWCLHAYSFRLSFNQGSSDCWLSME